MVPEWVGVFVLVLPLGLVLGYWSAMPRVWRLEKELKQALARKSELEMSLEQAQSKLMWLQMSPKEQSPESWLQAESRKAMELSLQRLQESPKEADK